MSEKTELNNVAQKRFHLQPQYTPSRVGGPDHAPLYQSAVSVGVSRFHGGEASSQKEAERLAAAKALRALDLRQRTAVVLIDGVDLLADLWTTLKSPALDVVIFLDPAEADALPHPADRLMEVVQCVGHTTVLFAYLGCYLGANLYDRCAVASRSPNVPSLLASMQNTMLGLMHWPCDTTGIALIESREDMLDFLK
jgi:hypothetical protein